MFELDCACSRGGGSDNVGVAVGGVPVGALFKSISPFVLTCQLFELVMDFHSFLFSWLW